MMKSKTMLEEKFEETKTKVEEIERENERLKRGTKNISISQRPRH
jgi:hypothetical protein